ncbi:MAG: hypothetical protein RIM84_08595 [Alphaproteobacteria bacterium]
MLRRLLRQQVRLVAEGGDPPGVGFDADAPPIETTAAVALYPAGSPARSNASASRSRTSVRATEIGRMV